MRTIVVRRGVLVSLGVATGTLAAAALMTTAPTASADDNPNVGGGGDIAVPALVPSDEYANEFTIGVGNAEDTFTTTWDFTGLPTTTESTTTLPTGYEAFGFTDSNATDLTIGADTFQSTFQTALFDLSTPGGNQFELTLPVFEIASFPTI